MFTSRAEYRILLRQDNADYRLTPKAYEIGMISGDRLDSLNKKYAAISEIIGYVKSESISPEEASELLQEMKTSQLSQKVKIANILLRPQVSLPELINHIPKIKEYINSLGEDLIDEIQEAELLIKYAGYIEKEQEVAEKLTRLEDIPLDRNLDYNKLKSISTEARQKLCKVKPETIGQAARISGVSPSDISVLIVYLGR